MSQAYRVNFEAKII